MNAIWLFLSAHQIIVILVMGLSMWAAAYIWYLKDDIVRFKRDRSPHKWSVDMANKTVTGGRKRVE